MIFAETAMFQGHATPHRPAMVWGDRVVTYGMLGEGIDWLSRRFHAEGVRSGDTVAIMLDNPIRDVIATLALAQLGAVTATVRPDQVGEITRMGAVALVVASPQASAGGLRRIVVADDWFAPTDLPEPNPAREHDEPGRLCRIATTSGTTGVPKLVAATVGETLARIRTNILCHWEQGSGRSLLLVGTSMLWGFNEVMRHILSGMTICFATSGEEALGVVDLFKVDSIFAAPQQVRAILTAMDEVPATCDSVRFIGFAGSLVTPVFVDEIQRRICRTVAISYGSSEAGKTAAAPFERLRATPGAVGYVLPGRRIEVVDDEDRPLPPDSEGRIRVMAVAGGRPYEPGALYPDRSEDWFYPGDIGRLRADGLLVITGRSDEVINAGGNKIAPDRIDQWLATRRDLADAAAFGVIGPSGIPEVWIAVVPRGALDAAEIIAWCEARLPDIPVARVVEVPAIPRTAMGKVERARLKAIAGG
jgi:acyl-coenzyme A synthetase/AMP-(fatty) acid ligase